MFVPSGTMGNQVAIMTHTRRGDEVICSENAHIVIHEVGATAVLSGVCLRTVKSDDDQLTAEAVERAVRPDDIHMPRTGLVEMENALSNGRVMPLEKMKEVYEAAHRHGCRFIWTAPGFSTRRRRWALRQEKLPNMGTA